MRVIQPAEVDLTFVQRVYTKWRDDLLGDVQKLAGEYSLGDLRVERDARCRAGFALVLGEVDEAQRLARLAARLMAAEFELRRVEAVTIEALWPERRTLVVKAPSATDRVSPVDWVTAMSLAVALDDVETRDVLLAHRHFEKAKGVYVDDFWHSWVELWTHALAGRVAEAGSALTKTLELTDPKHLNYPELFEAAVLDRYVPALEVMYRALERNADGFSAAVEKALVRHAEHWASKPDEEGALVPALLLGAVRWGDSLGLRRTVDSPLFRLLTPSD